MIISEKGQETFNNAARYYCEKGKRISSFTRFKHIMYSIEEKCETAKTPGGYTCSCMKRKQSHH